MLCNIVDSLLTQQYIRSSISDLVDHILEHVFLLVKERLHLIRVLNIDLRIKLGLFHFQRKIHQSNLCLFNTLRHARMDDFFVKDDPFDQLSISQRLPRFLFDLDIFNVNIESARRLLRDLKNRVYCQFGH